MKTKKRIPLILTAALALSACASAADSATAAASATETAAATPEPTAAPEPVGELHALAAFLLMTKAAFPEQPFIKQTLTPGKHPCFMNITILCTLRCTNF